jgi:hypothetical protein
MGAVGAVRLYVFAVVALVAGLALALFLLAFQAMRLGLS